MDFFGREDDIRELRRIRESAVKSARFTVVTGRRRVGKTELLYKAFEDRPYLYFLVTRSAEKDLCAAFQEEYSRVTGRTFPSSADKFASLFRWIMEESVERPLTLVIDEFQELDRINPSIFSEMAGSWDHLHRKAKINLVVCGSVNRLMNKIFYNDGEPLYGRNTAKLTILPFSVSDLKSILGTMNRKFTGDDLLTFWTFTGGVARYVEQLVDEGASNRRKMIATVFRRGSPAIDEGKAILIQEFGKDYGTYFSILSAIASGKTSYGDIRNVIGMDPGAYLNNLETEYALVSKVLPAYAAPGGKNSKYKIEDRFFRYWFRFIWKNQYLIELGKYDRLREIVDRDFDVFSGEGLESYFRACFLETKPYTRMAAWWDRKNENEIDLVCEDEGAGKLDFYEVKRDFRRFDRAALETKVAAFLEKNPSKRNVPRALHCVSLSDM